MIVVLGADVLDRVLDRGLLFGEIDADGHGVSNLSGDSAPHSGGMAAPITYAVMISAVIGAKSQPLREWPAAMSTSPEGPIIGQPSGDIGRMPVQGLPAGRSSPGSAASE